MDTSNPQPLYKVESITPEMIRAPDGSYQPGYRVTFRVPTGAQSYVIVPRSDSFEEDVHQAAEAEARKLIAAHTRPVAAQYIPGQS